MDAPRSGAPVWQPPPRPAPLAARSGLGRCRHRGRREGARGGPRHLGSVSAPAVDGPAPACTPPEMGSSPPITGQLLPVMPVVPRLRALRPSALIP